MFEVHQKANLKDYHYAADYSDEVCDYWDNFGFLGFDLKVHLTMAYE
jgi:hypothetical protein